MQARLFEFLKKNNKTKILIVKNIKEAKKALCVYEYLGKKAFVMPDIRLLPGDDTRSYMSEISKAFVILQKFYKNHDATLIAPFATLTLLMPKIKYLNALTISFADEIDLTVFKKKLLYWGYSFVDVVTTPGEVAFRGEIIDIYPPNSKEPVRINLFDIEVETIYHFDVTSQKRVGEELEEITIYPAFLALEEKNYEILQQRVQNSKYETFSKDIYSLGLWEIGEFGISLLKEYDAIISTSQTLEEIEEFYDLNRVTPPLIAKEDFPNKILPKAKEYREVEVIDINKYIQNNIDSKKITILSRNETQIRASSLPHLEKLYFKYIDGILNIANSKEAILSINKEEKKRKVKKATLILDEIAPGEYVVHQDYGVGIFRGIVQKEVLGAFKDFVAIEYANEDMLYVPVEYLEVIDRYIAPSGSLPTIDKLGKGSFAKLKGKVKEKLFAIAKELMEISAKRLLKEGKKIVVDRGLQEAFLHAAPFKHTQDQIKAIEEILDDLSSGKIMDRLLSADVGFGKTEVAMNAIFAVVKNGYQAAIVAPTTLLSMQHFKTLKERLEPWGIKVTKLDRFVSAKQKKAVLESLKDGSIDVVVGTHALLNASFKNLGLVVIDEEHKFGVKQKEALKKLTIDVHLLSMSATPIPRSLNMALSQIKSFSQIFTPPSNRAAVRTFVKNFDIKAVGEAIRRELRRGGQIFYIYNSIAMLEQKKQQLLEEIPNLRITTLHSKVSAAQSEKEMLKFEQGEYDLLLSTSIVESGIHLPRVNTIIIDGAQNFGIADLHQLRGRVGRGGVEGYCYYFVNNRDKLNENAKRRLLALESHSELGSGAILAMHDLEIRGGGNLVGEAQSGHIKQIGYSLYLKMLEDTIKMLSNTPKEEEKSEVKLNVNAYLNEELICEDRLRLELYRRLSQVKDLEELYEIEEEIEDRFGKLDKFTKQFIDLIAIKVLAKEKRVKKISNNYQNIFIEFFDEKERKILTSPSKDSDDILQTTLSFLKSL